MSIPQVPVKAKSREYSAPKYTMKVFCEKTGYVRNTVRKWVRNGVLPDRREELGHLMFSDADVEKVKARKAPWNKPN